MGVKFGRKEEEDMTIMSHVTVFKKARIARKSYVTEEILTNVMTHLHIVNLISILMNVFSNNGLCYKIL